MPKEILLYSSIHSWTSETFMNQINESAGKDLTIRVNSPGGSVFSGWGMVAKSLEHEGKLSIKVDGVAASMSAVFLLFHNDVEALNVSNFMLHRADTYAKDEASLKLLSKINKEMRAAFERKLDVESFEKISGVTMDAFFNSEEQIDVWLTAKEAKKIGLISKINKLEPKEFEAMSLKFAAFAQQKNEGKNPEGSGEFNHKSKPSKSKKMNFEQLRAEHPELVSLIIAMGVEKEHNRVMAWNVFHDVDSQSVLAGIKDGRELTPKDNAEFSRKMMSANALNSLEAQSDKNQAPTGEVKPTANETELEKFESKMRAELGLDAK